MLESMRKWMLTLAALMLGLGVLLIGLNGAMSPAQAQQGQGFGTCEVVLLGQTDVQTAEIYTRWLNGQLARGHNQFMALPGVFPVVCAWSASN